MAMPYLRKLTAELHPDTEEVVMGGRGIWKITQSAGLEFRAGE